MKIGFVVNDIRTEEAGFTTTRLAHMALRRGHEVWMIGVGDLAYDGDECIRARGRTTPKRIYGSHESYFADLQNKKKATIERITVDDLDALMLRNVPSDDVIQPPLGCHGRNRVWPAGHAPRRRCAERPQRPREGEQQDVLSAIPGRGAPPHVDHPRS